MTIRILTGDCREHMADLPECSVDAIVCDPPYGLTSARPTGRSEATEGAVMKGFMGMAWDGSVPGTDFWIPALRVAKPGAYLLAFGGTRTFHRLACAIEDAGWEIRDTLGWLYGTGFPKSHNGPWGGTALKPAWEPIIMARKPLIGTVEANWREHGTGALNIDGCRVGGGEQRLHPVRVRSPESEANRSCYGAGLQGSRAATTTEGRWPANILHDGSDEVLSVFPDSDGQQAKVTGNEPTANGFSGPVMCGGFIGRRESAAPRGDSGSAARFFWSPKATRKERDAGLESMPDRQGGMVSNTSGQHITRRAAVAPGPVKNHHPTVKPVALMAYLCRLVTPPGGTVLDPFMGSGSTGIAALREGFDFIGIDLDPEHVDIARLRITGDSPLFSGEAA